MMKTFKEMELILEKRQRDEHSCRAAGVSLSDLQADVCSPPDTQLAPKRMNRVMLLVSLVRHFPQIANVALQISHRPAVKA